MTTLTELIERLERLTRPDRELDILIGNAVDVAADEGHLSFRRSFEICGMDEMLRQVASHNQIWHHALPRYTASIDDALTLVPKLCWARVQTATRDAFPMAWATNEKDEHSYEGIGASAAIALCIAALKAQRSL